MKGIILAGGAGTRLYPSTLVVSKQLLPVYDKPMIYYPLSVLMLAGIKEILIITAPDELSNFKKLLGDGRQFGVKFDYLVQPKPEGIAQALILAEEFIANEPVALVLGDNIFYGGGFTGMLQSAVEEAMKGFASIFACKVRDAERFGVVELDKNKNIVSIEEKPKAPKSNYVVTGLYFYPSGVSEFAKTLRPSKRNELEITDLNNIYLKNGNLKSFICPRGFVWLDTGLHSTLLQAGQYIHTVEETQGIKIACLEEIALQRDFISKDELKDYISSMGEGEYFSYVMNLIQ